jgi:hypothetical protein
MTNFTKNLMVAAAALVVAAGVASAQTLKADIPFAFQVGNKALAAGTYTVDQPTAGSEVYRVRNEKDGAIVLARTRQDPSKDWKAEGTPKMAFRCGAARCALVGLWDGTGRPAYTFAAPKGVDMGTRIAVVTMRREAKGD